MHGGAPEWRAMLDLDFALAGAAMTIQLSALLESPDTVPALITTHLSDDAESRESALLDVMRILQITGRQTVVLLRVSAFVPSM